MDTILYKKIETPIGVILIGANENGCQFIHFGSSFEPLHKKFGNMLKPGENQYLSRIEKELFQYFDGNLTSFTIKLALKGTPFQLAVWHALLKIPYGQTASYKDIAETIGRPKAIRAIGMANHANNIPIIIPCHRVIYHDGSLGGYGGGLDIKRFLLNIENIQVLS